MKRYMLRMGSEDCQAGKGYRKTAHLVQVAPAWNAVRDLPNPPLIALFDLIET